MHRDDTSSSQAHHRPSLFRIRRTRTSPTTTNPPPPKPDPHCISSPIRREHAQYAALSHDEPGTPPDGTDQGPFTLRLCNPRRLPSELVVESFLDGTAQKEDIFWVFSGSLWVCWTTPCRFWRPAFAPCSVTWPPATTGPEGPRIVTGPPCAPSLAKKLLNQMRPVYHQYPSSN